MTAGAPFPPPPAGATCARVSGREFECVAEPTRREGDVELRVVHVRVPASLRYFEGHFPHEPIVPGVAQLVSLVHRQVREAWPDLPAPGEVRRLKFRAAIRPGDELTLRLRRGPGRVRFEIVSGETPCTQGSFLFPTGA